MKKRQRVTISAKEGQLLKEILKTPVDPTDWVIENPKEIIHFHSYGGLSRFFEELTKEWILGSWCSHCRGMYWLPPRIDCPDCWNKMLWTIIDTRGARIYSHSTTNYPGAGFKGTVPCPLISVEIPQVCTKMMSYLSEFGKGEPYIGMPIRPVFRKEKPTRTILDLSWIPID